MQLNKHPIFRAGLALLGLLTFCLAVGANASATTGTPTFTTLYSFSALSTQYKNTDGGWPEAGLILGNDGCLYGTTTYGGLYGDGTVFKITSSGALTTLHTFSGTDGIIPNTLVLGSDGNFYGTTYSGGANSKGTFFKMTSSGMLTTLHSFSAFNSSQENTDGGQPQSALVQGTDGYFYGTASNGGANGYGTIFKITSSGTLTTLYSFNAEVNLANVGGANPYGALAWGGDGYLYGTAPYGGGYGFGSAFKITTSGAFTSLHDFYAATGDGGSPHAGLVKGSDGNYYGMTYGAYNSTCPYGMVFKMSTAGAVTKLYSFTSTDGGYPLANLILGSDGYLYGTTASNAFKIDSSGVMTTLHTFSGADGDPSWASLAFGADGNLYGSTRGGGVSTSGSIFKLSFPKPAGSTYALWTNSGVASLWKIPVTGSVSSASFGPFSGWTPSSVASDTSGNAYILWTTTTGSASIWKLSSSFTLTTSQAFGPYSGWTAKSLAIGPDGHVHVLWNGPSNAASIYDIVLGSSFTSKAYGPYSGWQATQVAVDSNNNTRVLWTDAAAYTASVWNITSAGVQSSQNLGPYTGWQPQSLAVGSDSLARVAWVNTSNKQASIFTIASNGSFTYQALGPSAGWSPTGLAVNNDGDSDLMWTSTSNGLSLYDIAATGSFTSTSYGPFTGWTPVAIAAGP